MDVEDWQAESPTACRIWLNARQKDFDIAYENGA
jgi:hypothetical protein